MSLISWLVLVFLLSVAVARSFCYFGMSRNIETGAEVDSDASIEERALAAAWARRFATKDLQ